MKKIILFITTLLIATAAASGQTTSRWGITAGATINEVHFKQHDIVPSKRAVGPQLGVTGEMNFSGIGFGVEGSLLYTLKQGKVNYGERTIWESQGLGDEMVSMHYLDVPLHLKFKYNRLGGAESTIMPMVFVGPQFSFLMHGNHGDINKYSPVSVYLDMGLGCELMDDENVAKNRTWYFNVTWFLK